MERPIFLSEKNAGKPRLSPITAVYWSMRKSVKRPARCIPVIQGDSKEFSTHWELSSDFTGETIFEDVD